MKIVEKNKDTKDTVKEIQIIKDKSKKEHVLIVAQEIKFARLLSGNEKKARDRVLKTLKKWLFNCFQKDYVFKEDDFTRVWKGLFYAVWMSDKPLVQEELCDGIAGVLDLFPPEKMQYAVLMIKAGFKMLATEWFGIDQHRIDKFLMLVRRYLRGSFRCLLRCQWSIDSCQMFANTLSASDGIFALKTPHYARNATSMLLHIIDCYLEELAKVSKGDIPMDSLVELLQPICRYTCGGEVPVLCAAARKLLTALLRQSESGLRYQDATEAWKKMGCPAGGPEALELVSDDGDDDDNIQENSDDGSEEDENSVSTPLDPRAGRVDVTLPLLPVPAAQLASMLRDMLAGTSSKAYKRVKLCMQRFERLSEGEYPLVAEEVREARGARGLKRRAARALRALEDRLRSDADELKLRGLSRKHRKRLLKKTRVGLSIIDDVGNVKQSLSNSSANNEWKIETAEPEANKPKQDTSNKENQNKKSKKNHDKNSKIRKRKIGTVVQNEDFSNKRQKVVTKHTNDKTIEVIDNKEKTHSKIKHQNKKHETKAKEGILNKDTNYLNGVKRNNGKTFLNTSKNKENFKNNVENQKPQKNQVVERSEKSTKKKKITTPKETKVDENCKPSLIVNKVKKFQKLTKTMKPIKKVYDSPKKVKFVLRNNSMQKPVDYYKSVRQSPSIPFDSSKKPSKTNLKPSTPSPINPFFKKKLKLTK